MGKTDNILLSVGLSVATGGIPTLVGNVPLATVVAGLGKLAANYLHTVSLGTTAGQVIGVALAGPVVGPFVGAAIDEAIGRYVGPVPQVQPAPQQDPQQGSLTSIHNYSLNWGIHSVPNMKSDKEQGMQIHVVQSSTSSQTATAAECRRWTLDVGPSFSIGEVIIEMCETDKDVHADEVTLVFNGEPLDNHRELSSYGIGNGDTLIAKIEIKMQIFVKIVNRKTISLEFGSGDICVHEVKALIQEREDIDPVEQRLVYDGKPLHHSSLLSEHSITRGTTLHMEFISRNNVMKVDENELDAQFNFQYPEQPDGKEYQRGGKRLERPYGWFKYAIRVIGKYEDDDWLGVSGAVDRTHDVPGEWPVSYHGTKQLFAESIVANGYEISCGTRFKYGIGIYTTPNPVVAEAYAEEFEYEGSRYKIIFMNRVNMNHTRVVSAAETRVGTYYVTSDETQVRPYAILMKKVNPDSSSCVIS